MLPVCLFLALALPSSADLMIPGSPSTVFSGDIPSKAAVNPRAFLFAASNPGILSFQAGQLTTRDLVLSKLPDKFGVGSQSLFYMKNDDSNDFIFTNDSRTQVYYGTNASGVPAVNSISCGSFQKISDIHITESAAGVTHRIVVADQLANKVTSYVLNPAGPTLCTSPVSVSLTFPYYIVSITAANPTLLILYQDNNGIEAQKFANDTMTSLGAATLLSSSPRSRPSRPLVDNVSGDLYIPIPVQSTAVPTSDTIYHFTAAFAPNSSFATCRVPRMIAEDFEAASRYHYVFCPEDRQVRVYDLTDTLIQTIDAGQNPLKMMIDSDGVNRYISILQSDQKLLLKYTPVNTPSGSWNFTTTTLNFSSALTDIGHFAALDDAVVVSPTANQIYFVSLSGQSLLDTYKLPLSIDSLAAQSFTVGHMVSAQANTAYTLTELSSSDWTMRLFNVGTSPVQIAYRSSNSHLYALDRDSNQISMINLATRAVTNFATQTKPVRFAWDDTAKRLWAINQSSQSLTTLDITNGSEVLVGNTALGFTPQKIVYQSSDHTLYITGGTNAVSMDAPSLTALSSQTLSANSTDLQLVSGGAAISSVTGLFLDTFTRAGLSSLSVPSSPSLLTSNSTTGIMALRNSRNLMTSTNLLQSSSNVTRLFSNLTVFGAYDSLESRLNLYPYSLLSSTDFPFVSLALDLDPQVSSYDALGEFWLGDSNRLRIQRIDANLQRQKLEDLLLNRPQAIAVWPAMTHAYISLRDLNAVAIYDAVAATVSLYSVCQSPRDLALDTVNSQLYIICPESNSISVVGLDGSGNPSNQTVVATDLQPSAIAINTANNRLYVANRNSNNVIVINTATNAVVTRITVPTAPTSIAINSSNNQVDVTAEDTTLLTQIAGATNIATNVDTGIVGSREVIVNTTTHHLFTLSPLEGGLYTDLVSPFTPSPSLMSLHLPLHISASAAAAKTYVTYPADNAIRIFAEAGTVKDVSVGSEPQYAYPVDTQSKVFVSNTNDTLSILNLNTDAVSGSISLASGCFPQRMNSMTVTGTLYLYVLCQNNDTMEIINTATNARLTPVSLR